MVSVLKLCSVLFLILNGVNYVELSYTTENEKVHLTFTVDDNFKPTASAAFSNGKECKTQFATYLQYCDITISNCQGEEIILYLFDTHLKKGVYLLLSVQERETSKSKSDWFIHRFLKRERRGLPEESPEVQNTSQRIILGNNVHTKVVETSAKFDIQFSDLDELTYFCDVENDVLMAQNPDAEVYKSMSAYNSATNQSCPASMSLNRNVVYISNCSLTTEVHLSFTSRHLADGIIGGKRNRMYAINCLNSQSNFTSDKLHAQSNFSIENVQAMFRRLAANDGRFLEYDSDSSVSSTGFKFKWSNIFLLISQTAILVSKIVFG